MKLQFELTLTHEAHALHYRSTEVVEGHRQRTGTVWLVSGFVINYSFR